MKFTHPIFLNVSQTSIVFWLMFAPLTLSPRSVTAEDPPEPFVDEIDVNYQAIAQSCEIGGFDEFVGPGSLLLKLGESNTILTELKRMAVATKEKAIEIATERYLEAIDPKDSLEQIIRVTDLKTWSTSDGKTSYVWCVSKLRVNLHRPMSQPRVMNRVWIDALSGDGHMMRSSVRGSKPVERPLPTIYPAINGDLLPYIAAHGDVTNTLRNSKAPLADSVRKWQIELREKWPFVDFSKFAAVYMLIELSGDCDFGKDGDLVWIVHKGPGRKPYEYKGEEYVNCRTGTEMRFTTDVWR